MHDSTDSADSASALSKHVCTIISIDQGPGHPLQLLAEGVEPSLIKTRGCLSRSYAGSWVVVLGVRN